MRSSYRKLYLVGNCQDAVELIKSGCGDDHVLTDGQLKTNCFFMQTV